MSQKEIFDVDIPVVSHLTYHEAHALIDGFYCGMYQPDESGEEYEEEKHYWRSGYMAGRASREAYTRYADDE